MDDLTTQRIASHSGSWYSNKETKLRNEVQSWLDAATVRRPLPTSTLKAIICPHAGFRFSGPTSAWSYRQIDSSVVQRVVLLGPSHHKYIAGCALPSPSLQVYTTPLGPLELDSEVLETLRKSRRFLTLKKEEDEDEHSLEMQLPFLRFIFDKPNMIKIIPILVGSLTDLDVYVELLRPLFEQTGTLFVISSDFCHWGSRFGYTYLPPTMTTSSSLNEAIEGLDKEGIRLIEERNANGFQSYLKRTGNTICGRHPILLLLSILQDSGASELSHVELLHYSQSGNISKVSESCVSYGAVALWQ